MKIALKSLKIQLTKKDNNNWILGRAISVRPKLCLERCDSLKYN